MTLYFIALHGRERYVGLRRADDPRDDGWTWTFGFWFFEVARPYFP